MTTAATLGPQLAQLLGLDNETVKTQIWPHLGSLKDRKSITEYLNTLIGTGPPQQAFLRAYVQFRFPPPAAATLAPPSKPGNWASGQTNAASSAPAPRSSSGARPQVSERDRAELERAFGSSGKVYVKNREEDLFGGLGGGKRSSRGNSGAATPTLSHPPPPPSSATPAREAVATSAFVPRAAPAPRQPPAQSAKQAGKKAAQEQPDFVEMSPRASAELMEVDRTLKTLGEKGKTRPCFCQARQHQLSPYTPICPSCALVLCTLNSPIHPCPSCSHTPLLSSTALASIVSTLHSQRESILARETLRVQHERDEAARERAAIRFPSLSGQERAPGQGVGAHRAYSNMAGAGPDLAARIEMAYASGKTVSGAGFGAMPVSENRDAPAQQSRVLRLDMKTKKVKVQTKVPAVHKDKGKERVELPVEEIEFDDGLEGWVDELDDGVASKEGMSSRPSLSQLDPNRPLANVTLPLEDRPKWVEHVKVEVEEQAEAVPTRTDVDGEVSAVPGAAKVSTTAGGKKRRPRGPKKTGTGDVIV